jgi:vacuolar-type H+-ATPase subunit I/STV1
MKCRSKQIHLLLCLLVFFCSGWLSATSLSEEQIVERLKSIRQRLIVSEKSIASLSALLDEQVLLTDSLQKTIISLQSELIILSAQLDDIKTLWNSSKELLIDSEKLISELERKLDQQATELQKAYETLDDLSRLSKIQQIKVGVISGVVGLAVGIPIGALIWSKVKK